MYDGEILHRERNRKGKEYKYNDYKIILYEGEYLNGERNGKGIEFSNNLLYEGEYLNGERNGKGKEFNHKNRDLIYEGSYLNGNRWNGVGKEFYNYNKYKFDGDFKWKKMER